MQSGSQTLFKLNAGLFNNINLPQGDATFSNTQRGVPELYVPGKAGGIVIVTPFKGGTEREGREGHAGGKASSDTDV